MITLTSSYSSVLGFLEPGVCNLFIHGPLSSPKANVTRPWPSISLPSSIIYTGNVTPNFSQSFPTQSFDTTLKPPKSAFPPPPDPPSHPQQPLTKSTYKPAHPPHNYAPNNPYKRPSRPYHGRDSYNRGLPVWRNGSGTECGSSNSPIRGG